MDNKRIIELNNRDSFSNSDYLIIDNEITGTKKIKATIFAQPTEEYIKNTINSTYNELFELSNTSKLIPGQTYLLSDYRTKYIQPTSNILIECDLEPLILTALTNKNFEPIVNSTLYPNDIIYYDFTNNLCEDKITHRNGFILRRIDQIRNIDIPNDWRFMKWARYNLDSSQYETVTTTTNFKRNKIYRYSSGLRLSLIDGIDSFFPSGSRGVTSLSFSNYAIPAAYNEDIKILPNQYQTFYTFSKLSPLEEPFIISNDHNNPEIKNIYIGMCNKNLPNNVFAFTNPNRAKYKNITMLLNCYNNTFYSRREESIETEYYEANTYFGIGCYNNSFNINSNSNYMGNGSYNNLCENIVNCKFGINFNNNKLISNCRNINISECFYNNSLYNAVNLNINNFSYNNTFTLSNHCSFDVNFINNNLRNYTAYGKIFPGVSNNYFAENSSNFLIKNGVSNKNFQNISNMVYTQEVLNRMNLTAVKIWFNSNGSRQYTVI